MQKEKIAELERTISSNGIRTYTDPNSSIQQPEEGGNKKIEDKKIEDNIEERNALSVRITELESLLLDSDNEVLTLQNMLTEKEKGREGEREGESGRDGGDGLHTDNGTLL